MIRTYTEPLVLKTEGGHVWMLLNTATTLMMVWLGERKSAIDIDKGEYHTCGCIGTVDDMLEICVITFVTTARLEVLWSTICVAWDTTACSWDETFTTFCAVIVC